MDRTREKRLQRAASRSRLGSNTRRKRVRSFSKEAHRNRVRNRYYCHELTTTLVKRYGLVALEDLRVPQYAALRSRHRGGAGQERRREERPESKHSRTDLGDVTTAAHLQGRMGRQGACGRRPPLHEPDLLEVRCRRRRCSAI